MYRPDQPIVALETSTVSSLYEGLKGANAIIIIETDASDELHKLASQYVAQSREKPLLTAVAVASD